MLHKIYFCDLIRIIVSQLIFFLDEMGHIQTGKTAETDYFAPRSADPAEMGHMVAA